MVFDYALFQPGYMLQKLQFEKNLSLVTVKPWFLVSSGCRWRNLFRSNFGKLRRCKTRMTYRTTRQRNTKKITADDSLTHLIFLR